MEDNDNNNDDFTLYILLIVSGILMMIDGLELIHIIINWHYGFMVVQPVFEKCIKFELISKTIFAHYSFFAATSAFSLTFFLIINQEYFVKKLLDTYLNVNYIIFGPLMLAFSCLGFFLWDDVVYICDKNNLNVKEFSISNAVSIVGCFLISIFLTSVIEFSGSFNFLLNSIMKREDGSIILGKFFWSIVHRRGTTGGIRNRNRWGSNASNESLQNNSNANNRNNNNNNIEVFNNNELGLNLNEAEVILPIRQNLSNENEVNLPNNNNNIENKFNIKNTNEAFNNDSNNNNNEEKNLLEDEDIYLDKNYNYNNPDFINKNKLIGNLNTNKNN